MDFETIGIIGMMLSPVYVILIWRMKVSRQIEIKVTKICTALKMKFPDLEGILK